MELSPKTRRQNSKFYTLSNGIRRISLKSVCGESRSSSPMAVNPFPMNSRTSGVLLHCRLWLLQAYYNASACVIEYFLYKFRRKKFEKISKFRRCEIAKNLPDEQTNWRGQERNASGAAPTSAPTWLYKICFQSVLKRMYTQGFRIWIPCPVCIKMTTVHCVLRIPAYKRT